MICIAGMGIQCGQTCVCEGTHRDCDTQSHLVAQTGTTGLENVSGRRVDSCGEAGSKVVVLSVPVGSGVH